MKLSPTLLPKTSSPSSLQAQNRLLGLLPHVRPNKPFSSSSSHSKRPKKKTYHREPDLDKAMDLQKKPALILLLRDLILSQADRPLLLRDLEKEVGFVKKWALMGLIQKQPNIFKVSSNNGPISVRLTESAETVSRGEEAARAAMEPLLVKNLTKLLMMSLNCTLPMAKIDLLQKDLGLPKNYQNTLIPAHPSAFSRRAVNGQDCLCLENWDPSVAITAREEREMKTGPNRSNSIFNEFRPDTRYPENWEEREIESPNRPNSSSSEFRPNKRYLENWEERDIERLNRPNSIFSGFGPNKGCLEDGPLYLEKWEESGIERPNRPIRPNSSPCGFSFKMAYPAGFRPNKRYLEEVDRWQKMAFPSPYLSARSFSPSTPAARKRAVAVLHEVLSLTMEKRLSSDKLDAFHDEYQLPCKLLLCLVKNHGIFYLTNKGGRSTVFLKEGYVGPHLREKCPLLRFYDRFLALSGRSYNYPEPLQWETPKPIV